MKKWNIYQKNHGEVIAIKKGFNLWAFLFVGFWALSKNLIFLGIIGFAATFMANKYGSQELVIGLLIQLVVCLLFGLLGNIWVSGQFVKKGYSLVETIEAKTGDDAMKLLLEKRKSNHAFNT